MPSAPLGMKTTAAHGRPCQYNVRSVSNTAELAKLGGALFAAGAGA